MVTCVHRLPAARSFDFRWLSRARDARSNRWMASFIMVGSNGHKIATSSALATTDVGRENHPIFISGSFS